LDHSGLTETINEEKIMKLQIIYDISQCQYSAREKQTEVEYQMK